MGMSLTWRVANWGVSNYLSPQDALQHDIGHENNLPIDNLQAGPDGGKAAKCKRLQDAGQ